jgi:hypothetical protein
VDEIEVHSPDSVFIQQIIIGFILLKDY